MRCDVAISRDRVTNRKMFDEWYALVQFIYRSAYLIVLLYREMATSGLSVHYGMIATGNHRHFDSLRGAPLLAMTW